MKDIEVKLHKTFAMIRKIVSICKNQARAWLLSMIGILKLELELNLFTICIPKK